MTTATARAIYRVQKQLRASWGHLATFAVWLLIGAGAIDLDAFWRGDLLLMTGLCAYTIAVVRTLRQELAREVDGIPLTAARAETQELEHGLLMLTGAYLLVAMTGGSHSFLYPLVYALVSFLAVLHRSRRVAAVLLVAAVALELLTGHAAQTADATRLTAMHITYLLFFAAGNALVLASLVRRLRAEHRRRVEGEVARMRREACDFRLLARDMPVAKVRDRQDEEARLAQGAVETIHLQVGHTLRLLRAAHNLQTAALLWVHKTPEGQAELSLKAIDSNVAQCFPEACTLPTTGLLSNMLGDPKPLRLGQLKGRRLPPYYREPIDVGALCAVPLCEGQQVSAILCVDRSHAEAFSERDCQSLEAAVAHMGRVLTHERVFTAIERDKYEQQQFFRASEMLSEALTLDDVYRKTFAALQTVAGYDLVAVTEFDDQAGHHRVLAVDTKDSQGVWSEVRARLDGLMFDDGVGLVAMAVKNRHHMPAKTQTFEPETVVFTARTRLTRARSLVVLPLLRGEKVLGTIVLASSSAQQYPQATIDMLRVITQQVSVSLQNARMYNSMELRATTDGLTGLTNHRAFQERLATLHALAERSGQKFSVILTDIDHFKSVNDTYGHPVGDAVLRRVAAVFKGRSRKVDIVARYGGEEFVLVLPDTDAAGAEVFANKLREEIGSQVMTSDDGPFQVTISMGVAEYPSDSKNRQELIEKADQALYHCKRNGRNCVIRVGDMKS